MITTKNKLNVATAFVFTALFGFSSVYAQLGGLKNAAKNVATKTTEKKAEETKKETKSTTSSATDVSGNYLEVGDKAFAEKRWNDAKVNYEKAISATGSGYQKSQIQNKLDKANDELKSCEKKNALLEKLYNEKKYAQVVRFYDSGNSDNSEYESNCLCDASLKAKIDESRKNTNPQDVARADVSSSNINGANDQKGKTGCSANDYAKREELSNKANRMDYEAGQDESMDKYQGAIDLYQQAIDVCPNDPGNADYLDKKKRVEQKLAKANEQFAAVADDGMTSEVHKKYVKQVVFSKTDISQTSPSEASFTNTFNLGDDIFSRTFLERSCLNEQKLIRAGDKDGEFGYRIYVDGKLFIDMPGTAKNIYKNKGAYQMKTIRDFNDKQMEKSTTFSVDISRNWGTPGDAGYANNSVFLDFYYNAWILPVGAHKIKMETVFYIPADGALESRNWTTKYGKEKILATGEFTLNVTEAGKLATAKKQCSMPDIKSALGYFNMGPLTKIPQATAWVKKDIVDNGTNATLIKVVEGTDWKYIKNGYGIILRRQLWGTAFLQDNETKLYYTRGILFSAENNSSGGAGYAGASWEWRDYDDSGIRFAKECLK